LKFIHHSSFIIHHSSFIIHHSSFIIHQKIGGKNTKSYVTSANYFQFHD